MTLPDSFARFTGILHALNERGFEAYFVGGGVRDVILGRPSKDVDITTSATPEQVQEIFPGSDLVGAHFGVVIVRQNDLAVEVATFRLDGAYGDGRHPDSVKFTTDVREDLSRRDFTINTLLMDAEGNIHDYLGGSLDLFEGVIKAVGPVRRARFRRTHCACCGQSALRPNLDLRSNRKHSRPSLSVRP